MTTEGETGKTLERLQGQSPCLDLGPDQDQDPDPEIDLHVPLTALEIGTREAWRGIKKSRPVLVVMTDLALQQTRERHPMAIIDRSPLTSRTLSLTKIILTKSKTQSNMTRKLTSMTSQLEMKTSR